MLANPPWRQLRVRAEKIPGDQKHDYELRGYSHTLNALHSSIQYKNAFQSEWGLMRPMFKAERFRGIGGNFAVTTC